MPIANYVVSAWPNGAAAGLGGTQVANAISVRLSVAQFGHARLVFGKLDTQGGGGGTYTTGGVFIGPNSAIGPGIYTCFGCQSVYQFWATSPIFCPAIAAGDSLNDMLICTWNAANQALVLHRRATATDAEVNNNAQLNDLDFYFAALIN